MRSMFTLNMEGLQLRLYQFSSLLQEILPDLSLHLSNSGVHAAMYASQWFLTLFAYVFPMNLVTRIYDIIFAEGAAETIMRVAIAMLKRSQDKIVAFTEFEDILDFVTTKKLCGPYTENFGNVIRDAMALSDIITRDKMDQLSADYEHLSSNATIDQQLVARGRFNFWKRKGGGGAGRGIKNKKKPDMKRSASAEGSGADVDDLPPVLLKKRWSSVSSRRDLTLNSIVGEKAELEQLKQQHQKTLNELAELKFDKQDLECERDALKLTIVELERRRIHSRSYSIDSTKKPPPFLLNKRSKPITVQCDDNIIESPKPYSDLAVASKEDDDSSIAISRQNSIHQSMLSSSDYTTTEFDDDELSLSLTTTTLPIDGEEEELSSQLVHLKVKNFELEQHIEKLNQDIELVTSKFDMVNEGQMALVDKLMTMKSEMDEFVLDTKQKDEALELANNENEALKQELEDLKQALSRCRLENGVLIQNLQLLQSSELNQEELPLTTTTSKSTTPRMRRHSTTSSSMLTLVRNKQIQELEESLTAAKIKLAEYESCSHQQQQAQQKRKPSIYGRVLHAIKYNNNS